MAGYIALVHKDEGTSYGVSFPDDNWNGLPGWGWGTLILPYLDQGNLHRGLRLDLPCWASENAALVQTKLGPGESTDGAVFFATAGKPMGPAKLVVRTNTDTFEFLPD